MNFKSRFDLYEKVIADTDSPVMTITGVSFRSSREPVYEVNYIYAGTPHTLWIEEPRLEKHEN